MKYVKFTEEYLEKFFDDSAIEDDNLFDCLKDRKGNIEESTQMFENDAEHLVLTINLMLK